MEIQSVICPPLTPQSSAPPPSNSNNPPSAPAALPAPGAKKRVRRWHHRGFTGCSTCRRRHVRCDEASPSCKNCTRLGLDCDGAQGRMTFKVYGPPQGQEQPKQQTKKRGKKAASSTPDGDPGLPIKQEEGETCESLVVSPTTLPSPPTEFRFEEPLTAANILTSSSLDCLDTRYYSHFINRVSSLLLIYDNSINTNPYREHFPDLARSSPSMMNAMQALGALHLSNTSDGQQRITHFQQAMGKYGEVVKSFRNKHRSDEQLGLTDLATCLLLSLFEMMDSQHHNWAIHLKGAREIYRSLFLSNDDDPAKKAHRLAETNHPIRNFLISLLSYLDVAGACATSDGTIVEGSYWRTHAGGWEYNLGLPSLTLDSNPDNQDLVDLRQTWAVMMEIQAAISSFGQSKSWMSPEQQDLAESDLLNRLVAWRANAPECIHLLSGLDDDALRSYPYPAVLEYVGCIEAYEKATIIFLHKVAAAERPDRPTDRPMMQALASRILALIEKLAKDVGQLAVLWPLFVAGRETTDETEQKWIRQTMIEVQRFGFKNVEKGLEELERIWFKHRAFPEGWAETMDDVRSTILLP